MVDNNLVCAENFKTSDLINIYAKKYEMHDLICTAYRNQDLQIYNAAILSLQAIVEKVFVGPHSIYLHGSRLIGCSFSNSDVDIVIDFGKCHEKSNFFKKDNFPKSVKCKISA